MIKKIMLYTINFFLVIFVFLLISLLVFSKTVFNKNYMLKVLEKENYYEETFLCVQDNFEKYSIQSGLDNEDLKDIYTKELVKQDIINVIDGIYEQKEINISTELIIKNLDDKINEILSKNNRTPDKEEKEAIKTFEGTIAKAYDDSILLSKAYIKDISNIFKRIENLLQKGLIIDGAIILIVYLIIIIINKSIVGSLKFIGIDFMSVGIITILIKILLEKTVRNILILNLVFSKVIISIANFIISKIFITGIIIAIIGLLLVFISNISMIRKYKKKDIDDTI